MTSLSAMGSDSRKHRCYIGCYNLRLSVSSLDQVVSKKDDRCGAVSLFPRRSPDTTLRSHILLLALFFAIFVATTLMFNYTSALSIDLLSDVLTILDAYLLYRAVMTLSPLGRVKKEVDIPSKTGDSAVAQPGGP